MDFVLTQGSVSPGQNVIVTRLPGGGILVDTAVASRQRYTFTLVATTPLVTINYSSLGMTEPPIGEFFMVIGSGSTLKYVRIIPDVEVYTTYMKVDLTGFPAGSYIFDYIKGLGVQNNYSVAEYMPERIELTGGVLPIQNTPCIFILSLSGTTTITFDTSLFLPRFGYTFELWIQATAAVTITWPASITWIGIPPVITRAGLYCFAFRYYDSVGGIVWKGNLTDFTAS